MRRTKKNITILTVKTIRWFDCECLVCKRPMLYKPGNPKATICESCAEEGLKKEGEIVGIKGINYPKA